MRTRMFRSTNPMFRSMRNVGYSDTPATYAGITTKTVFLFMLLVLSAYTSITNMEFLLNNVWIYFVALIGGFISVMVTSFSPKLGMVFAPIYSIFEGVVLGALVAIVNTFVGSGLAETAVIITLSIFVVMLVLYSTGIVRVGSFLRRLTMSMLWGLIIFGAVVFIMSLLGSSLAAMFYGNLQFMLIYSLISAAIASLMILLDLDNCTRLVEMGAPQEYEWNLSLGLIVTIVWLFIEILRILLIFASRRD